MPRLFAAVRIRPTDNLRSALDTLKGMRGVKAVAPVNLHYTIRFMGDVDDTAAARIQKAFATGELDVAPFDVAITGAGAFRASGDPRVIWAGADPEGDDRLKRIAAGIDAFVDHTGIGERDKPFVSHLTLARVKRPSGRARHELDAFLDTHRDTSFGTVHVDRVHLVRSTLTPQGPEYEDIAELRLT